jgi:aminopeptidase N
MVYKNDKHDDDKSTLSNHHLSQAQSLDWKAFVDFEKCCVSATATYHVKIIHSSCNAIHLDTRALSITHVALNDEVVKIGFLKEKASANPILANV